MAFAYYNGAFGDMNTVFIPLSDRAIYFGDGVYDAAIGKNGTVFLFDEHVSRLLTNADKLGIKHRYTHESLTSILQESVKRSNIAEFFLYFQLSRSSNMRVHTAASCEQANLLIIIKEHIMLPPSKELNLITHEDLRYYYCDIKTLNLLPSVIAATSADIQGCDEAVLHRKNIVTECAHSNISILKNEVLYTHPLNNLILPGITRRHLLNACDILGITVKEIAFTLDEMMEADEVLISSTTKLCLPAKTINGIQIGGRDIKNRSLVCNFLYDEFVHYI